MEREFTAAGRAINMYLQVIDTQSVADGYSFALRNNMFQRPKEYVSGAEGICIGNHRNICTLSAACLPADRDSLLAAIKTAASHVSGCRLRLMLMRGHGAGHSAAWAGAVPQVTKVRSRLSTCSLHFQR